MADDGWSLPMDVIEIILLYLPVKSLLRFKAVSRVWNDLISSPAFIKSHLQRSKINSPAQLLFLSTVSVHPVSDPHGLYPLLRLEDGEFHTELLLDFPAVDYFVICYCDGLFLFLGLDRTFIVWNPSCGKHTMIYYPYKSYGAYGLCYDPVRNDVKIVIVCRKHFAVFSCIAKSWMKKEFQRAAVMLGRGTSVDGAVYWVQYRKSNNGPQDILCFDSGDDELKVMEKPRAARDTDRISLFTFKDSLCVWIYNVGLSVVQIWSWNGSCWTQIMTIQRIPHPLTFLVPVYFQENMILMHVDIGTFLIYSPTEHTFEEFEDDSIEVFDKIFLYMETLLFIPGQRRQPHRKSKSLNSRS